MFLFVCFLLLFLKTIYLAFYYELLEIQKWPSSSSIFKEITNYRELKIYK